MTRPKTDVDDFRIVLRDGHTWHLFELEPDHRIRLTSGTGPFVSPADAACSSTYSAAAIWDLIAALTCMVNGRDGGQQ